MSKPKILWLSDSPMTCTGYATVTKHILNKLSNEYECHCLAHNYHGQTIKPGIEIGDNEKLNFFVHGNGWKKYGQDIIAPIIRKYNIDIFGVLLDTFMAFESGFLLSFFELHLSHILYKKVFFYYKYNLVLLLIFLLIVVA